MYEMFKARAEAAAAEVHRFATKGQALDFIVEFVGREQVSDSPDSHAVWADCPFVRELDRLEIAKRAPGIRFDVTRELAASARVGISQADYGIANTGTLAQVSTAFEQRLVSMLPPVHVALLGTNRIVADLSALLSKLSPKDHGYLAFITGPSRTADIERVLTIGVHGPGRLVIVLVDDL